MAKTIEITYGGKEYRLEFTRRSIEQMEKNGFQAGGLGDKPVSTLPALFAGAFIAHHKFTKRDMIDEIYAHLPDKPGLVQKLAEMYNEPIMALMDEPEEDEGNAVWKADW